MTPLLKIAFVDDEPNVLEALKWVFKDEPYNVYAFQNPLKLIEKLEEEDFAVVVADQVMPEIEGIKFLQLVKDKKPTTICIIMTAQPDLNIAITAMNQGNIFRFVNKPWDVVELKTAVKNAVELYELKLEIRRLWEITKEQNKELIKLNNKLKEKIYEQSQEIIQTEEERKELEAQLIHSQKMEAMGTLAGGIAHDFNNILSGIIGYTEVASLQIDENSQVKEILNKVLEACERAKLLIDQILSFSRQRETKQESIHLGPIILEVVKLLRASLPRNIEIINNIESGNKTIKADPTRIHQILMNLCTNSAHAMRDKGGQLSIALSSVEIADKKTAFFHDLRQGSYLKISISDTGHGISKNDIDRIFDPYFTTKKKGEGTGLGLSVVHGIVNNYKGTVIVDSEQGVGTTFDVYLPVLR